MPVQVSDKSTYLEIGKRALPSSYVEPMESQDDGLGLDLFCAAAAVFSAIDRASSQGTQGAFIRPHSDQTDAPAAGPTKARGVFLAQRQGFCGCPLYLPAGLVIEATRLDSFGAEELVGRYLLVEPIGFAAGSSAPVPIVIEAEFPGWFGNLDAASVALRFASVGELRTQVYLTGQEDSATLHQGVFDTESSSDDWIGDSSLLYRYLTLESAPSTIDLPLTSDTVAPRNIVSAPDRYGRLSVEPGILTGDVGRYAFARVIEWNNLGVVLTQPTAVSGGNGGLLDARGSDYDCPRITGEPDVRYADRLEALDDTVVPSAMRRVCDRILGPLGVAWRLLETGDVRGLGGMVWDLHPWDFGTISERSLTENADRVQGAVLLSKPQTVRFFVVAVSPSIQNFPHVAAQLYGEIKSKHGGGVQFQLVIDPNI